MHSTDFVFAGFPRENTVPEGIARVSLLLSLKLPGSYPYMCACKHETLYVCMCEHAYACALGHIAANGKRGHIDPPALQAGERSAWLVLPPCVLPSAWLTWNECIRWYDSRTFWLLTNMQNMELAVHTK